MIKQATSTDASILAKLAIQMWDSYTVSELEDDFTELLKSEDVTCYLLYEDSKPIGFAQCQLRHDYVEGTESSPVGYLEGIYVEEEYRHRGYAKELLRECEKWAASKGCTEFASDCELDNRDSFKFHMSMGFEEANRIICFTKKI